MERSLAVCLVLGAVAAAAGASLPVMQWTKDDVSAMSVISADYYNKVSRDDAVYKLYGNNSVYMMDEASRCHRLQFKIKETLCQKADNKATAECALRDDGVVKSCTSSIFAEKDRDIFVVTCDNLHLEHKRIRRSKRGGKAGKKGGRRGKDKYKSGYPAINFNF